jgi:hypothetical protein
MKIYRIIMATGFGLLVLAFATMGIHSEEFTPVRLLLLAGGILLFGFTLGFLPVALMFHRDVAHKWIFWLFVAANLLTLSKLSPLFWLGALIWASCAKSWLDLEKLATAKAAKLSPPLPRS